MRKGTGGFTVVELMIGSAMVAMVGLLIPPMLRTFTPVKNLASRADSERSATKAADFFINDLREADPGFFDTNLVPKTPLPAGAGTNYQGLTFSKTHYTAYPSSVTTTIEYTFTPLVAGGSTGSLIRTVKTVTGAVVAQTKPQTVLMTNMIIPTAATPLIYKDTTADNILVLTLLFNLPGQAPARIVRRMAIKG